MEFRILGPLEVRHEGRICTPSAPKARWTLALLLVSANRIVDTAALVDQLWGERPPRSAMTTMQTYIYQLRRSFAAELTDDEAVRMIVTQPPGYRLQTDPRNIDANVFEGLAAEGRALLHAGEPAAASRKLFEALDVWRGPVLADVPAGRLIGGHATDLERRRLQTHEAYVSANIELGDYRGLIPKLRALLAAYPLHEWFYRRLIEALREVGRRGEALAVHDDLQRVLQKELGLTLRGSDRWSTGLPMVPSFGHSPGFPE